MLLSRSCVSLFPLQLLQEVTSTLDDLAATFARPPAAFSSQVAATLAADGPHFSSPHGRSSPSRTSSGAAVSSEASTPSPGHPWRRPSVRVGFNADGEVLANAWAVLRALLHSRRESDRTSGRVWLTQLLAGGGQEPADRLGQKAVPGEQLREQLLAVRELLQSQHPPSLHLAVGPVSPLPESSPSSSARQDISQGVQILCDLLSSPEGAVKALFFEVVDRLLLLYETDESSAGPERTAEAVMGLLSAACQLVVESNSGDTPNVLQVRGRRDWVEVMLPQITPTAVFLNPLGCFLASRTALGMLYVDSCPWSSLGVSAV